MAPMKVLIVGGGIAGPALAHWLSRIGANITLIERSPEKRASGQQLDLRAQGIPVMKKMGIEAAVRAACVPEKGMQLVDNEGRVKCQFPVGKPGSEKQFFTSEFEIMRRDLVQILYGLTENQPNVQHLYNTTVADFTQDDESDPNGKVHVTFGDGRKEDFDLVVAADGTGSRTRKIMLGLDAPDPRHRLGGNIAFFSIPSDPSDSDWFTGTFLPGSTTRAIGTRKDCPELTRVYLISRGNVKELDEAHKSGDLAALKKAWADLYEDGGWQCARFTNALRNAPEADDLYSTPQEEVRLPEGSWSKGRVVLLGDAAHSQTANGFGTTWGLVAAYVLAGEIASLLATNSTSSPPTAAVVQGAKNYEKLFRPVSTAGHNKSQWPENFLMPKSRFMISIMFFIGQVVSYFGLHQMLDLEGEQGKWQLPEYPALDKGHLWSS